VIEPSALAVYVGATLALLVVPGPSVLYVVALSLRQGRVAGLASVAGVGSGAFVHFVAAALGLSALLAASATAFAAVKWAGAAYLVYLGVRTWLDRGADLPTRAAGPRRTLPRIAAQGMLVTVLNPKLALFVLAFVPQFLDPARGPVAAQALLLGAVFVGLAAVTDTIYALSAGWLGGVFRRRRGAARAQRWLTGSIYVGLGLSAAATGRSDPL
jgi:threonine/homoserine/homoserine lactone efflux protein